MRTLGVHALIDIKMLSGLDERKFGTAMRTFSNNLLRIVFLGRERFFTDIASELSSFFAIIVGKIFMRSPAMRADWGGLFRKGDYL